MNTQVIKKAKTYYWLMITSFCMRLFWMVVMEPRGMKKVLANHPEAPAAAALPPIVYGSTVILIGILIAAFLKKSWSYTAGLIFGIIHLGLILYMPIAGLNPGIGPYIVTPICVMMIVFSYLTMKQAEQSHRRMNTMKKKHILNWSLLTVLFLRFLFLLLKEPAGHWNLMLQFPDSPYIAWLRWSIVISTGIIVPIMLGVMLTQRWAYWASIGMGVFHVVWMGILTYNEASMDMVKFLILTLYSAVFMGLAFIMLRLNKKEHTARPLFTDSTTNIFLGVRLFYLGMLFLIMSVFYLYRDFGVLFVVSFLFLAVSAWITLQHERGESWVQTWMLRLNYVFLLPLIPMLFLKTRKTFLSSTQAATGTDPIVVTLGIFIDIICIAVLVYNTMVITKTRKREQN